MLLAAFTTRYRVPVLPLLAVFAAIGAASIAAWIRERSGTKLTLALVVVLAFLCASCGSSEPHEPKPFAAQDAVPTLRRVAGGAR